MGEIILIVGFILVLLYGCEISIKFKLRNKTILNDEYIKFMKIIFK